MKEYLRTQTHDGKIGLENLENRNRKFGFHSDTTEYNFVVILLIVLNYIKFKQ